MTILAILFAATLSAGNAEFDQAVRDGARKVALRRVETRLAAQGPAAGALARKMLENPRAYAGAADAKERGKTAYLDLMADEYATAMREVDARLGGAAPEGSRPAFDVESPASAQVFEAYYARERASACAEQAKGIAGSIRPAEADVESKEESALRAEMTAKVAAQQKNGVFEENLKYISETIVDPVIDSAKKEMKRQREYLTRTRCEGYAPSVLAKEIEANLRRNVEERRAKESDPSKAWGVFPKTLQSGLQAAVEHRTLDRVAKNVDDVPVAVEPETILKTIAADPEAHRKADESENIFRGVFMAEVLNGSLARAAAEAPSKERGEFEEYVRAHAAAPLIVRAVETRIRREVLPKWRAARATAAKAEADRIWPTLADRTWYPNAELADAIAARSDYDAAVKSWRTEPGLEALAQADGGRPLMEETAAAADQSVSSAFDLARSAIAAQTAIVGEVEPSVLGEAKDRKSSFWRRTPDFKAIVGMLTEAVEAKWGEKRLATLWGDGERPANADEQHVALFPSVRKRIELVARQILEDMEKPDPEPEKKPEPEKPEDPTESDQQSEDEQLTMFSIVVQRDGETVTVKLEQGKTTVAERSAKAKMSDYQGAMKEISDKLGADILKLK